MSGVNNNTFVEDEYDVPQRDHIVKDHNVKVVFCVGVLFGVND